MGKITKTDANELKALVNQKRDLLQEQLTARRNEIRTAVRKAIMAEYAEQVQSFGREVAKLRRRSKTLEADAADLFDNLPPGLEATRGSYSDPISVTCNLGFQPENLEERVGTAVGKIEAAYAVEKVNLNKRFVDLREQLVTMSLDGDAKDFLALIPTVDEILPLPNGSSPSLKELVAA